MVMGVLLKVCLGSELFIADVAGELLLAPQLLEVSIQILDVLATEFTLEPESSRSLTCHQQQVCP